jgi:putative ABC transport system substrate-binding protein
MRRRDFLGVLGGAAAWPFSAGAQQGDRVRRVGILLPATADDLDFQAWVAAFLQGLGQSGWIVGRNLRIDTRWAGAKADDIRKHAAELAALAPNIILAHGSSTVRPLLQATRTVPIVFPISGDPVGAGFVKSLAQPGGNVTGFMTVEFSFGTKWLELLKELAPTVTRVAVLRDTRQGAGTGQFAVIQAMAGSLRLEVSPTDVRDAGNIERDIAAFARTANGGLIVTAAGGAQAHRKLITALAARHKLPAVYNGRHFVTNGGLASYDADYIDQYRRSATYVDRIAAGTGADQVRACDQPQDRQGTRPHRAAVTTRPRRRGDRITIILAAVHFG